jgi:hypothetical protein
MGIYIKARITSATFFVRHHAIVSESVISPETTNNRSKPQKEQNEPESGVNQPRGKATLQGSRVPGFKHVIPTFLRWLFTMHAKFTSSLSHPVLKVKPNT